MGRFLNVGKDVYERLTRVPHFVDKTELINRLLEKTDDEKFICNARPRRFGKSVTVNMLAAYFSRGTDSRHLFAPLKCRKDDVFLQNMNHYDTIILDIQSLFVTAAEKKINPISYINKCLRQELSEAYPMLVPEDAVLSEALAVIHDKAGCQFVLIFDEWDYPVRELDYQNDIKKEYLEFLRGLFKSMEAQRYVRLAYLTGIMPIVRVKGQSSVNNFREYTMTEPLDFSAFIGFTEDEVYSLCQKFGADFWQIKEWYDGYRLGGKEIYNPLSVLRAVTSHDYTQYWTATGTYGDIEELINRNFRGLREDIIKMLSGIRLPIRVSDGTNDLHTFGCKEEVITALIHLGYFAYDKDTREAYVPNKEIQDVFYKYMSYSSNDNLSKFMEDSQQILNSVLAKEAERTAQMIQQIHDGYISAIEYNNENSLSCVIMIALIASFAYYYKPVREYPSGKGFADLVYLPLPEHSDLPVIVVELKWNKNVKAALAQIKERRYPNSLREYAGEILLVGVAYDKKQKEHSCEIETFE